MALTKEDLLGILQHLGEEDFKEFKFHLHQGQRGVVGTYPGVPRCRLEGASRTEVVELMAEVYTTDTAHVTGGILQRMRKLELLQTLIRKTLCSPNLGADGGSVVVSTLGNPAALSLYPVPPDMALVLAHRYFPPEFSDFITVFDLNQDQMTRVLSELSQIVVHVQGRSERSLVPTVTSSFVLGALATLLAAPFMAGTALVVASGVTFNGLVTAGAAATGARHQNRNLNHKDQSRAEELERELNVLLQRLHVKLLALAATNLSHATRTLVQETVKNIQEVLERYLGRRSESRSESMSESSSESGFEWIPELTDQGRMILRDLGLIKQKLYR